MTSDRLKALIASIKDNQYDQVGEIVTPVVDLLLEFLPKDPTDEDCARVQATVDALGEQIGSLTEQVVHATLEAAGIQVEETHDSPTTSSSVTESL